MKLCDNSAKSFFLDPDPPWWIYFIFKKDISFEMTIHRMAFNEYTLNTFCMLWQIARMKVPCRLLKIKSTHVHYLQSTRGIQAICKGPAFEQSVRACKMYSRYIHQMPFDGSSFWRICPFRVRLEQTIFDWQVICCSLPPHVRGKEKHLVRAGIEPSTLVLWAPGQTNWQWFHVPHKFIFL